MKTENEDVVGKYILSRPNNTIITEVSYCNRYGQVNGTLTLNDSNMVFDKIPENENMVNLKIRGILIMLYEYRLLSWTHTKPS
jgi:hypothetical protein